jgi:glutathione peroxidase
MKYLILSILSVSLLYNTSIYSISISGVDNNVIHFNAYKGKKIMLVNIATGSERVSQLRELQDLYNQYNSSLVIIGIPSNSFGHETRTNQEIKSFCFSNYGVTFPLAAKANVKGEQVLSLYKWLTTKSENSYMDEGIKDDFQKYIINENGDLIAIFAGRVSLHHPGIIQAITEKN